MMREHPELDTAENRTTLQQFRQLAGGGNQKLHVSEMEFNEEKGEMVEKSGGTTGVLMYDDESGHYVLDGNAFRFTQFVDVYGRRIPNKKVEDTTVKVKVDVSEAPEKLYYASHDTLNAEPELIKPFVLAFYAKAHMNEIGKFTIKDAVDPTKYHTCNSVAEFTNIVKYLKGRKDLHHSNPNIMAALKEVENLPVTLETQSGFVRFEEGDASSQSVEVNPETEPEWTDQQQAMYRAALIETAPPGILDDPQVKEFLRDGDNKEMVRAFIHGEQPPEDAKTAATD